MNNIIKIINSFQAKLFLNKMNMKLKYLIFGGLTTLLNIFTYKICTFFLGITYITASVIAWIIAVMFAFLTNKYFVFESQDNNLIKLSKEILLFFTVRVMSLFLDLGTMYLLVSIIKLNDMYAKIAANIVVVIVNYFASKLIIFRGK